MGGDAHDDELVRQALAGDARAFAVLYVRYRDVVWKLAYYKLGDRHDADDVTQQTFLSALRDLPRYRATGSFKAWLLTICRNACSDRRRSAKPVLLLDGLDQDQLAGRASMVDAAEWMAVRAALRKLPRKEAVSWFLIEVLGCTSEEAAEVVGVHAASTMRSRLKNARRKLEQELCRGPGLVPADPERTAVCGLYHLPPHRAIVAALRQQPPLQLKAAQRSLDLEPRLVMTHSRDDDNWTLLKFFEELERAVPGGERVIVVLDRTPGPDAARWRGRHSRWELTRVASDDSWREHVEELLTRCVAASCRQDVATILALIDAGERFVWSPAAGALR